jgi:hypothetical protein
MNPCASHRQVRDSFFAYLPIRPYFCPCIPFSSLYSRLKICVMESSDPWIREKNSGCSRLGLCRRILLGTPSKGTCLFPMPAKGFPKFRGSSRCASLSPFDVPSSLISSAWILAHAALRCLFSYAWISMGARKVALIAMVDIECRRSYARRSSPSSGYCLEVSLRKLAERGTRRMRSLYQTVDEVRAPFIFILPTLVALR